MNPAFKLFRLQQIDTQLDELRSRFAEIDRLLSDDKVLDEAKEALEDAKKAKEVGQKEVHQAEEEVKAQQAKLKENQGSLYGGKVTNTKELQDLQLEAEVLTRHLRAQEDLELEKMMRLEDQQSAVLAAEANLEAVLAQRGAEQRTLGSEQNQLNAELARLEDERQSGSSGIPKEELSVYDGLRKSKGGQAVAKVKNKTCSACGAELSASLAEAARSTSGMARCDNCKRILYAG